MKNEELHAIAALAAKNIKTEEDLNDFRQMLTKITVEAALNAELDDHLGFAKHEPNEVNNNRNELGPILWTDKLMVFYQLIRRNHEANTPSIIYRRI